MSCEYMTTKQFAELLGVAPKTLHNMIERGDVPQPDIGRDGNRGQTKLWHIESIRKWQKAA